MKDLLTHFSKLSLDNGSRMTRDWLSIGSAISRKLLAVLICLLLIGVGNAWSDTTDEITVGDLTATNTTYTNFSNVAETSSARYAGNTAKGNSVIQLRNSNSCGMVSTTSGGVIKSVTISWNGNTTDGRAIEVYGSNTAYSGSSDLYDSSKKGVLLGTIAKNVTTPLSVVGDFKYIGLKSNGTGVYISKFSITWTDADDPLDYVYNLVTDVSDLAAGDRVIILNTGGTYAMSTTQNTNNRAGVAAAANNWSISGNTVILGASTTVEVMTIGVQNSHKVFVTSTGYLRAANNSTNYYLKTNLSVDSYCEWTISLNGSYEASIVGCGDNTNKTMQFNSNLFACYASASYTAIKIYKQEPPSYTVTWSAGNEPSFSTQTDYAGTALDDPGTPTASTYCPGGKVFVGWTATEDYSDDDDPPADLFTSVSGLTIPEDGITYYAVYATAEGEGGTEYVLTPYDEVTAGTYVIASYNTGTSKYLALTGAITIPSTGKCDLENETTGFTITTNKFTTLPTGACEFTLAGNASDGFTIKNGDANGYLGYTAQNTSRTLAVGSSYSTYTWKVGELTYTDYPDGCYIHRGLESNYTITTNGSSSSYVRGYTGNTKYKPIYFFKKGSSITYSEFETECATSCEAPTAPINGSITGSSQTVSWTAPSSTPGDGYLVAYSKNYSTAPGDDVYETGDDEHFTVLTAATATASIPCNAEGTYYWWVRSKCSDSDFSSCSEWVEGDDWTMRAIYLNTNYEWYAGNAKFAIHYWNDDTPTPVSGWSKFMVEESGCATGIYKGFVPEGYNNINFGRFNPAQSTDPTDWTNRWNQTSDLTIPTSPAKDYFTLSSKTGDNDYNGSWSNYAPYYTISFNNNAVFSTTSAPSSQCILEGAKASAPTNPLAMGKEVDGWYKEAGCVNEWDFSTQTVSANQTLYAHWADVTSKTIYLDCSKDLSASPSDKKWDADNVVLFAHAYIDGTSIYTDVKVTSAINSCDAHVYAFEIPGNADYVTFARCATGATSIVWDGGSKNVYNQFSLAVEASKDWYKVTGWDAGSLESTAFAATTYTVSFAANSGSGTMSAEEVECDDDYTIKTNTFTRDCYAFTGWKADVDVKISGATVSAGTLITAGSTIQDVESNITLTAQWSQYSCTVTLNKNGATTGTNQTVSATCGSSMPLETTSSVAIAVPSKTGYTFLGYWDTDASSGGNQYYSYDGSTLSSYTDWDKETNTAQTLYARWEANVDHFIDDMHKTTGYTGSGHSESGANYTMPGPLSNVASGNECETNHYIFVGWVVASGQDDEGTINGTSKIYRPGETKSATNATYYAVWAEE